MFGRFNSEAESHEMVKGTNEITLKFKVVHTNAQLANLQFHSEVLVEFHLSLNSTMQHSLSIFLTFSSVH